MASATECPVCGTSTDGWDGLARHLVDRADASDASHVMWLNRSLTKERLPPAHLVPLLQRLHGGDDPGRPRVRR